MNDSRDRAKSKVQEAEDRTKPPEDTGPHDASDDGAIEIVQVEDTPAGDADPSDLDGLPATAATAVSQAEEVRTLRAERDRLYEAWLRATADFDNYRKRTERERGEFRQQAMESLIQQMLPVLDNFERALESLPEGLPKGLLQGVTLIHKQLEDILFKQGLSDIETSGQTFDPHLHEAVETETRTDVPHHQILSEIRKGYRLGKRVLRPSLVKVCINPEEDLSETEEAGPGDRM